MYLKSIEIQGFKSFANKIKFDFPEGITGIVGPNGSGKSNVADAVRWVFGEQRIKQLRGNKMEDVIFAGTENRKPQSFAYVAITLDNADRKLKLDYSEVTVSRRVFRSGESEYMINGSAVRLKDVQELFYDTGIGKEGYSIIGQGQIDKILQGKPEERRELFDEAAGVVKFKKRKTIALKKLENERLNLERIGDITKELEKQIGPLKKQSEAAAKFLEYSDKLKKYDLNLFLIENGDIQNRISDCREKESVTSDELDRCKDELEKLKAEYESVNNEIVSLDGQIEEVRKTIEKCSLAKETFTGQIAVLNEQIKSAESSDMHFEERRSAIEQTAAGTRAEKEKLENDKQKNQERLSKTVSDAAAADSALLELQNKIEDARLEIISSKERLVELTAEKGRINSQLERLDAVSEQMSRRKKELLESLEKYASEAEEQDKKILELGRDLENAKKEENDLEAGLKKIRAAADEKNNEINDLEKNLDRIKEQMIRSMSALDSVKNITERYEGYGSSIKEVMKLKGTYKGIYGVVADIIQTEKEYETAIETALGGSIQNVVTDTESTAKQIIEYLKKNKLGRATFLPVKAITSRGGFKNVSALDEEGVIGLASDLVTAKPEYSGVVDYLLGRTVICDNIDNAINLARKYKYTLMIVTLDGELLSRGGSLTGGAFRNKSNLLGRRREIADLEEKISKCQKDQKDTEAKIEAAAAARQTLLEEAELQNAKLQEQKLFINTVQINLDQAKSRKGEIDKDFESVSSENEGMQEQADRVVSENNILQEELAGNEAENENLRRSIDELEALREQMKGEETERMSACQDLRNESSRLNEQNGFLTNSIIRLEMELERLDGELSEIKENSKKNSGSADSKKKEILEIEKALNAADEQKASAEEKLNALNSEKEKQSSANSEFHNKREELQTTISELDKEAFRLAQTREKLEDRFQSRSDHIWEEYELTFGGAEEFRDENLTDVKDIKENISKLRSDIKSLGTINVSAIEEYKEVSERYGFLKGQYDDVKNAEADLVRMIKDLDREMRRQFKKEFAKIQAEFGKVFREMFGGGRGELVLEEDVDVLDAGIAIIAQPPGKKLQNMMQLSGGEKALTAIAVLFSIQNLKPSPFCILDEIEAALDDSNIGRFAGYLHKLSGDVQFIVITHRKGTMEAADRLYGITMQEKGVSTLITVNLEDYNEESA